MLWFKTLREMLTNSSITVFHKNESNLCMIVSEQEGAEIWIDDKKTAYTTPRLIVIPKNSEIKITLKLIGHKDKSASVRSGNNLSYYYCNLERIPLRLIHNEIHQFTSN